MALPVFKSDITELMLMQTKWAAQLNVLLGKPQLQSQILKDISLTAGSNTINHKLGRKLQGWKLVRQRALASIYDDQDNNQQQDLTLVLVSSAICSVDIEVF